MVRVIKPETGWAIVHWTGRIYIQTVSRTRKDAIAVFMHVFVPKRKGLTWKTESQYGVHKAIKVDVLLAGTAMPSAKPDTPSCGRRGGSCQCQQKTECTYS